MKAIYEATIKIKVEEELPKDADILSKEEIDKSVKERMKNEFSELTEIKIESEFKITDKE